MSVSKNSKRLKRIISFLKKIEKAKLIEREIHCSDLKRRESDAEHQWHLAMFLILFSKELPKDLDFNKMIKMALMHDLIEIYAGDTFAFDKKNKQTQKRREKRASRKLFSQLPEDLERQFIKLFNEFEKAKTPEAKTVKSFDKIQPILQNICSNGWSWKKHDITYSEIENYKRKHMLHNDFILGLYERLLNEALRKQLVHPVKNNVSI